MSTTTSARSFSAIVVMGVTGSGKSTVGAGLAQRLGFDFVDGDDLHPAANVAKMTRGEPLTDADRWPWLDRVGDVLADSSAHPDGVIVACSALKRPYRDRIRARTVGGRLKFLLLDITAEMATARLNARKNHFMPPSLVQSQFATLERPMPDETDALVVQETEGVDEMVETASKALGMQEA